jgi:hypothetical protein
MHRLAQIVDGVLDAFLALARIRGHLLVAFLKRSKPLAQRKIALRMRERLLHRRLAQMVVAVENGEPHHQRVEEQREPDRVVGGDDRRLETEAVAAVKRSRYEAGEPGEHVEADLAETASARRQPAVTKVSALTEIMMTSSRFSSCGSVAQRTTSIARPTRRPPEARGA